MVLRAVAAGVLPAAADNRSSVNFETPLIPSDGSGHRGQTYFDNERFDLERYPGLDVKLM